VQVQVWEQVREAALAPAREQASGQARARETARALGPAQVRALALALVRVPAQVPGSAQAQGTEPVPGPFQPAQGPHRSTLRRRRSSTRTPASC